MRNIIGGLVALLSVSAFADGLTVRESQRKFVLKSISVENVKGIELTLKKDIVRDDCNQRTMNLTQALVRGDGEGWYDQYFLDAGIMMTEMHCPIDEPVSETISSEKIFIKSFTNQYVNSEVQISVVIPEGYELEVMEVK